MKKRTFAFLLAMCLVLNMFSGIAFATETEGTCENGHTAGAVETVAHPTCTSEGEWVQYCGVEGCGAIFATGKIEMLPHTLETEPCKNDFVDPTCTEEGHKWYHCASCGQLLKKVGEDWVVCDHVDCECTIPALGHDYEIVEAVEPTCTEDGHNEYRACSVCGEEDPEHPMVVIPATGHGEPKMADDYVLQCNINEDDEHSFDYAVDAVCSICGELLEQKVVKPAPHTWGDWQEALAPTCTEAGYETWRECSVCGRVEGKEPIDALGHDFTKWVGALAGSCTEDGRLAGLVCSRCGESHPDPELGAQWLPAPGHVSEVVEGYEPTCTEEGLTDGEVCSVCDEVLVEQEVIPALGHDYKTVLGVKATCTEDGEGAHKLCSRCGDKVYLDPDTAIIPAHGHSNEDGYYPETAETIANGTAGEERDHLTDPYADTWMTDEEAAKVCDATCLTDGYKGEELCSFCNVVLVPSEVLPALGHDWELTVPGTLPTCTEPGISDLWDCSRCEAQQGGEPINARGHKWVSVEAVLPTCDTDGNIAYDYCTVCGYATNEEYLDENMQYELVEPKLIGTKYNPVVETVGWMKSYLEKVDGEWVMPAGFKVDAYNHAYRENVRPLDATCTENGIEEGATRCLICDEYFDLVVIPALGHDLVEVDAIEADCLNDGLVAYVYCTRCGRAAAGTLETEGIADLVTVGTTDYSVFVIPALGHAPVPGVALDPTCHEDGHTAGVYCDRCKITIEEYEIIPALGCDMVEIEAEIPATCTEPGKTAVLGCTRCDCTEGGEDIPATGHDAGEVTEVIPATCTEYGFGEGVHCTKCAVDYAPVYDYLTGNGYITADDLYEAGWLVVPPMIDPLDHDMSKVINAAPSCTREGYDNYSYCKREGCDHYVGTIIPALGHDWADVPGGAETAPTCTEAGTDGIHQCTRCLVTEAVVVPALGHDWVLVEAVEATCAAVGNIEYEDCSRCNLIRVEGDEYAEDEYNVVVEDDGLHDNLMHVDAQMATCNTPGHSDGQYCDVCGYNDFTEIAPDADAYHSWLFDNQDALIEDGTLEWVVTNPGDGSVGSGMEAILCPCCGYIVNVRLYPEVQMGDVNMDGDVDVIDALMVLQYSAGVIPDLPNKVAANCFVDEGIDVLDALWILNNAA